MTGLFALFLDEGKTDEYIFSKIQQEKDGFLYDEVKGNTYYIKRRMLSKFPEDKWLFHDEDICICTDAVFLNSNLIENKYHAKLDKIVNNAYTDGNLEFIINEIRGIFSGIIFNLKKKEVCIFTDHLALKPIFYMVFEKGIIVSSEVNEIAKFCRLNHMDIHLSLAGAYAMLSYGYMYENYTLVEEIKKLKEGNILKYTDKKITIDTYHQIKANTTFISKEEAIVKINQLFCHALELQVHKNAYHQYENVIPLSAGMDCRMTSYIFRKMFNQSAINFTYSETGEYDFTIPAKMAHDLNNRWIFKSLDNGLDLYNIDEAIKMSDGLIYYAWSAQLGDFLKMVNTKEWGIIHTGVLGDVILGTYVKNNACTQYNIGAGAFSTRLIDKLKKYISVEQKDYETGMIQNRGINGVCLGYSLTFRHYAEDLSPFLNIDFLDFCLSLPVEMRQRHDLYYAWVKKFYPEATKYKHNGISIKGNKKINIFGKKYRISAIPDLLNNSIKSRIKPNYGMNPFQAWYNKNSELRSIIENYYIDNKHVLENWKELSADAQDLFIHGNVKEKIQVISLLGSIKHIFLGDKNTK